MYLLETRMSCSFELENSFFSIDNIRLGVRDGSGDRGHGEGHEAVESGDQVTQLGNERNVTVAEKILLGKILKLFNTINIFDKTAYLIHRISEKVLGNVPSHCY